MIERVEIESLLREVLSLENEEDRNRKLILALIQLDTEEELEKARQFLRSLPEEQQAKVSNFENDIDFEKELREEWISDFESLDSILVHNPALAKRVKGAGYKVALLRFAEAFSCDAILICFQLSGIIEEFEAGASRVSMRCEYISPITRLVESPRNDRSYVLCAMAFYDDNPSWILRNLFLTELVVTYYAQCRVIFVKTLEAA